MKQQEFTLKQLKELASKNPYAGRKYPNPGYERLITTREEVEFFYDLNSKMRSCIVKAEYWLENNGGTLKKRRSASVIGSMFDGHAYLCDIVKSERVNPYESMITYSGHGQEFTVLESR